jgi:hypothetical protein
MLARWESDPKLRAGFIDMAGHWKLFAERAERHAPITQQKQQIQPKKKPG